MILLLSKGGRLEGRNKLADFIDFLAKRQQLFWYIRLPIRLKRDLAGLNFSSTTRELTDLLTLIPQAVDLSLKEPIFKGITPLISLAANLSKTTDIGHDLKLKGSHRLTRDELVDLVVDRLKGEKADTNSSKSLQETNSKSKDQPQTLRDRINSKTLSFDSASVVELLTNLPEASPLLLTRLFKIRQLQADIFKEIASDLYKEFKIDIPTKDSYTLVELNQVNDRIKDHLLNLGEGRIEAGLNRVLKARFAAKVDGRLKLATSLKFASSYILPREDSLILFRPLDLEEARGILVKQLEQGEGQTKGENLDLNTLFESYSKDLAGKDAEKIIVQILEESDFKAGLKDLKVADKPITNEDLKAVNNLLVSRLKQQESLQLTALVDNLTKVFLSAEAAASNSDLRLDLNGLSLTNLANNLNKGKKQEIISLFSNELRSLLLERQRPATKQQAISSSKQAIKEANR